MISSIMFLNKICKYVGWRDDSVVKTWVKVSAPKSGGLHLPVTQLSSGLLWHCTCLCISSDTIENSKYLKICKQVFSDTNIKWFIFNILSYKNGYSTYFLIKFPGAQNTHGWVCIQIENTILTYLWKCKGKVITKTVLKKSNIG